KAFVDLGPALSDLAFALALQLIEQLFDRHRRATRPFLRLLIKFVQTDWQCSLRHADAILDFAQVGRVLFVALLITRVVEMHQDPFVIEIGFEHASAGERHSHWHRFLIELEHGDVLELVPRFFTDVNFSPGKLVDHLIAAEERHRIARGQIKDGAAQFFLRGGRHLDREPKTKRRAHERNYGQRNGDTRHAHAIRAERDQFVVGRAPAEDEEDRSKESPRNGEDERERKNIGDEREQIFDGHIVVHQQRQQLAENVTDDEDETQDRDRKEHVYEQLATHEFVDQ